MKPSALAVRPGPYVLAVNTGHGRMYACDARGRLLHAYREGGTVRRALDHQMLENHTLNGDSRRLEVWRALAPSEQELLLAEVRQDLLAVRAAVAAGQVAPEGREVPAVLAQRALAWIDAALSWDLPGLAADGRRYRSLYLVPLGPLPPDRHQTVVLQIAAQQHGETAQLRDPESFAAHSAGVREFIGPDPLRREVFLAGANALLLPPACLENHFRVARRLFPESQRDPCGGLSAFVDAGPARTVSTQHWAELAGMGLRRLYVNISGGDATVQDRLPALKSSLHAAGLDTGIFVLAGVGGQRAAAYARATAAAIRSLPLRSRDTLYIARRQDTGTDTGDPDVASPAAVAHQVNAFRRAASQVRVVVYPAYDLRRWWPCAVMCPQVMWSPS